MIIDQNSWHYRLRHWLRENIYRAWDGDTFREDFERDTEYNQVKGLWEQVIVPRKLDFCSYVRETFIKPFVILAVVIWVFAALWYTLVYQPMEFGLYGGWITIAAMVIVVGAIVGFVFGYDRVTKYQNNARHKKYAERENKPYVYEPSRSVLDIFVEWYRAFKTKTCPIVEVKESSNG